MKMNLRPISSFEVSFPGILAVSYETRNERSADVTACDYNITLYKQEKILSWVQLCPCNDDPDAIEFRNRFIDEEDECSEINEKVLRYAEKWSAKNGYKKITVNACSVSLPYYLRNNYRPEGEPFMEAGNVLYKLVKLI